MTTEERLISLRDRITRLIGLTPASGGDASWQVQMGAEIMHAGWAMAVGRSVSLYRITLLRHGTTEGAPCTVSEQEQTLLLFADGHISAERAGKAAARLWADQGFEYHSAEFVGLRPLLKAARDA